MTEDQDAVIAGVTDGAYTLLVADFADTQSAWLAYEELKAAEDGRTVEIEGVVVIARDADGKVEVQKAPDHSTSAGLKWGVVGGVALGIIFPPSILGSAVVAGAAGAAGGRLRQRHQRNVLATELENSIERGHSGLVALVSDPRAVKIRHALDKADAIVERTVDEVISKEIKAAAKEASAEG